MGKINDLHVSDPGVLNYDRDIKGHNLIRLYAGVGAGKNGWAQKLAKEGNRVLLITSRANTADVQSKKLKAKRHLRLEDIMDANDSWGETALDHVSCTNSDIEKYVNEKYKESDPSTHLWHLFDYVILDEAHSVTLDASFSEAPFYVVCFLKQLHKINPDCHIIFMTATQEPLDWLFDSEADRSKVHSIDLFNTCIHLEPDNVRLYPKYSAIKSMIKFWEKGKKAIYFANSISSICSCIERLKRAGVPEEDIGIAYRDKSGDQKFSQTLLDNKARVKASLLEIERLPDDIKIFISTTTNKEGVSIENEDISVMFSESCQIAELVQMAGRIRSGLKDLCVIYDAAQHKNAMTQFECLVERNCLSAVRKATDEYLQKRPDELGRVIDTIHGKFSAIRYDPFAKKFVLYKGRLKSVEQKTKDTNFLSMCLDYLEQDVYRYGRTGYELLKEKFPYSRVVVDEARCKTEEQLIKYVREYIIKNGYVGDIDLETREKLKAELNELLDYNDPRIIPCAFPIKNIGSALKKFNFGLSDKEGVRKGRLYTITDLT